MKELWEKIKEALFSCLPVTAIVYIFSLLPGFDFSKTELLTFSVGAVLLILGIGGLMNVSLVKVMLMSRETTWRTSDVISTYVYRQAMSAGDFGMATAVGLFNSVVNLILLLLANLASKKWSEVSIF